MSFYENFKRLCEKKGVKPSRVAEIIGINKSTVSVWKKSGKSPNYDTYLKICQYFNVKDINTGHTNLNGDDLAKAALFGGEKVTDEMWEEVKRYADFIRARNKNV